MEGAVGCDEARKHHAQGQRGPAGGGVVWARGSQGAGVVRRPGEVRVALAGERGAGAREGE